MIETRELTKRFGSVQAVDGVSLEIGKGEAFGLLGPNGAGKTTTIHLIVGVLAPDGGTVRIDGSGDPTRAETRRRIGVAPQSLAIYEELTAEENLAFFGRLYGLGGARLKERVERGLELAGLADRRRDRAAKYSGGMKRRLNLACALVHEPEVLFCDEPTVGVDPQSRNHVFECIEGLKREGMTLIYTTHYMEEAQRLCDRVAIMDRGKVLALDTVDGLVAAYGGASLVRAELGGEATDGAGGDELPGTVVDGRLEVETTEPLAAVSQLLKGGTAVTHLAIDRPNLERVFLHLTGRSLRD